MQVPAFLQSGVASAIGKVTSMPTALSRFKDKERNMEGRLKIFLRVLWG